MSLSYDWLLNRTIKKTVKKINKLCFTKENIINEDYLRLHKSNIEKYKSCHIIVDANEKKIRNDIFETDKKYIDHFQEVLRVEREYNAKSIQLVAFDISKTLIEYISNDKLKMEAANKIVEFLSNYNIKCNQEDICEAIENGIAVYSKERSSTGIEEDEVSVYKKYILPCINEEILNLSNEQIKSIIKIWMTNSVTLKLRALKINEIVNELHRQNIVVVTISDMLGDMSFHALKKCGIYDIFDAHFCSNMFGVRKNNKYNSLYNIVNKVTGIQPRNCLMIGNDHIDDVYSSQRAGWNSIFVSFNGKVDINSDFNINETDDFLHCFLQDQIRFLPKINTTPYIKGDNAKRDDKLIVQLQYQLRGYVKNLPDREYRTRIYKEYLVNFLGEKTRIGNQLEIRYPQNIYIGENCQINDCCTILNEGMVIIGDNVMIARNVFMSTYYHNWKIGILQDSIDSWAKGNTKIGCISIGSNTWIGPNCVFEANVFVGHHSIIAANTLVQSGVYPPYSFIAGNPGKIKKNIFEDLEDISKSHLL